MFALIRDFNVYIDHTGQLRDDLPCEKAMTKFVHNPCGAEYGTRNLAQTANSHSRRVISSHGSAP